MSCFSAAILVGERHPDCSDVVLRGFQLASCSFSLRGRHSIFKGLPQLNVFVYICLSVSLSVYSVCLKKKCSVSLSIFHPFLFYFSVISRCNLLSLSLSRTHLFPSFFYRVVCFGLFTSLCLPFLSLAAFPSLFLFLSVSLYFALWFSLFFPVRLSVSIYPSFAISFLLFPCLSLRLCLAFLFCLFLPLQLCEYGAILDFDMNSIVRNLGAFFGAGSWRQSVFVRPTNVSFVMSPTLPCQIDIIVRS